MLLDILNASWRRDAGRIHCDHVLIALSNALQFVVDYARRVLPGIGDQLVVEA